MTGKPQIREIAVPVRTATHVMLFAGGTADGLRYFPWDVNGMNLLADRGA